MFQPKCIDRWWLGSSILGILAALGLNSNQIQAAPRQGLVTCQMPEGSWMECPDPKVWPEAVKSTFAFKKAQRATKSTSLLVALAGGPGQIATEAYLPLSPLLEELNRSYDLLILNPRGTALPSRLLCPELDPHNLAESLDRTAEINRAQACLQALGKTFDLNQFGTDEAARDLEAMRAGLGYEKISFYAISYGTRLALRYASLFPAHVDRLVLEGVLPPEAIIGQDTDFSDKVIKALFDRCQKQATCHRAYPHLADEYSRLLTHLKSPAEFKVKHPIYGDTQTVRLDAVQLKHLLFPLLYSEYDADLVPSILHDLHDGDIGPLLAATMRSHRQSLAEGLYFAVTCREDIPFLRPNAPVTAATEDLKTICSSYGFTPPKVSVHEAIKGDWPTLLLSGELDPVTSPTLLTELKKNLSHAEALIAPGKGHNVFYLTCAMKRIVRFLALRPEAKDAEKTCTDEALPMQVRGGPQ